MVRQMYSSQCRRRRWRLALNMSKVVAFSIQNLAPFIHSHVVMTITIALSISSMS